MEKKLFSIGEISKIKGITKKALRFYERIGLLIPYYVNPYNRYRYYSIEQFIYIDIIKALRVMEISPIDIQAVLKNKDTDEVMGFLDSQKEIAVRKIDGLRKVIGSIDGVQNIISNSLSSVSHKDIYTRKIAQRHIVTLVFNNMANSEDAIIEFSKFDWLIEEHHLINTYETGILFKFLEKDFVPSMIFNTVDIDENSDSSITSTLPAGEYICVCYNKENASEQTMKISRYCNENGLEPTLFLQVELLNDVFSVDSNYFELQMPV
jgi:MerR family transcriptional activator of bmr gene